MNFRHPRRRSRRQFVSLVSAAGAGVVFPRIVSAGAREDTTNIAPYVAQGQTGEDSISNCGPASVAAAIRYSGVASPSVEEIRHVLGFSGPTSTDQWADLLNHYNVPWRATWTRSEMDAAIATGHVVLIAAWMADISSASDFEDPWSPRRGQVGRYDGFSLGHSLLIVGCVDRQKNYEIHDPNVFHNENVDWYQDGTPKGAYRKYRAAEIWNTVDNYAGGFGIAVPPPSLETPLATTAQLREGVGETLLSSAGGKPPQGSISPSSPIANVPRVLTNSLQRFAAVAVPERRVPTRTSEA